MGYVSGEYLTRLQDAQNGAVSDGGESNDDDDNGACEVAQNASETTTLMNDSGQTIMLFGNWRVADD